MRNQNHCLSNEQFALQVRQVFGVDSAPPAVTFEHDAEAIRQAMIEAGVLKPQSARQLEQHR